MSKTTLRMLFGFIFVSLLAFTSYASTQQSVFAWQGLTQGSDRWWTIATLIDAYYGFITFFVWVAYKETALIKRIAWFIAIMLLGNMAMSAYVLWQLRQHRAGEPLANVLLRRSAPESRPT
jgi:type IV secretory pathway TraG/TraD family ATPase VirD4